MAGGLDLGGTNCVIDAACASSVGALNLALLDHQGDALVSFVKNVDDRRACAV